MIFLEDCPAGDLEQVLSALRWSAPSTALSALLPWSSGLRLLQQAAAALAHIHDCGILHNDLRAANCLLARQAGPNGDTYVLKITDFGKACSLPAGDTDVEALHHTNALWAAPEVMDHCRKTGGTSKCCTVSRAADVYCFGGLVYEVLTGLQPHYLNEADREKVPVSSATAVVLYGM